MSTGRSDFWLCPEVPFSVSTSQIYTYGYLASWNPFLIGIILLSLALMERHQEVALAWLSEMSLSDQELVFCGILSIRSLKFEEKEMLQCSQMVHAKRKGDGGSSWWWGILLVWWDFQQIHNIFTHIYYFNNSIGNTFTLCKLIKQAYFFEYDTSQNMTYPFHSLKSIWNWQEGFLSFR